jgi:hypothetical protein
VLVSLTMPLNISVILTAVKSSFNRKIGLIHIYVLVVNIFVRVCMALALTNFIPPGIRFCKCSIMISSISAYLQFFSIAYQPYMLVSLAVFQLLIIKGKKKLVNYKITGVTLFVITTLTIILPLIFIGVAINGDGGAIICYSTIGCAGIEAARLLSNFAFFHVTVWVPSVSILVAATVWSCAIFKKSYAGHDNGLTRRIVAMPLVMPVHDRFSNQYCYICFISSCGYYHSSKFGI